MMNTPQEAIEFLQEWVRCNTKKGVALQYPCNINEFQILVREGQRQGLEDLVLFTYSNTAQFRRAADWHWVEKVSRGLVIEKETGNLVANPYYKFFNYGEFPEDFELEITPEDTIDYKHDGSLGICFFYKNEWWMTTYGSLNSEQGIFGTTWLRQQSFLKDLPSDYTHLGEIAYPENRIVTNYGDYRGFLYQNSHHLYSDTYQRFDMFPSHFEEMMSPFYDCWDSEKSIKENILDFCKTNKDYNFEGFVVTKNNVRYKFKTDAYLAVHRVKFDVSAKRIKEAMLEVGNGLSLYKETLPNEFYQEVDKYHTYFETKVNDIYSESVEIYASLRQQHGLESLSTKQGASLIHKEVNALASLHKITVWSLHKGRDETDIKNEILYHLEYVDESV